MLWASSWVRAGLSSPRRNWRISAGLALNCSARRAHRVALPGQPRLQIVQMARQDALDHSARDRPFADAERLLEGERQVLLDLQRRPQPARQQVDGTVLDHVAEGDALGRAGGEQPADVGAIWWLAMPSNSKMAER